MTLKSKFWIHSFIILLATTTCSIALETETSNLKLADAITESLAKNLGLQIERLSAQIEEEGVVEAESDFDATIFGNASVRESELEWIDSDNQIQRTTSDSRTYNAGVSKKISTGAEIIASANSSFSTGTRFSPDLNQVVGGDRNDEAAFTLSITQPLLRNYGARVNRASIKQAVSRQNEAFFRLQNETADLLETTEIAYWRLADSYERRTLRQSNIKLANDQLRESQERKNLGMATELEVLQAESNLAQRKQEIIQAEEDISNASDELMAAIGSMDENLSIDNRIKVEELSIPTDSSISFEQVLETSFELNFNTAIQGEILKQLEQSLILAQNEKRPEVDLTFSSSYSGLSPTDASDAFNQALDQNGEDMRLQLGFSVPWGRRAAKSNLRQVEYTIDQANIRLTEIKQDLVRSVRTAWRTLATSKEQLNATKTIVKLQQATFDQETLKYEEGLASLRDVLETQRDLDNAILRYLDAQISTIEAEIRLDRVQGTILERHNFAWDDLPLTNSES